ncbi:MAG: hypothetical protein CMQ34_03170 [Gammaproteobacteria bacterium]|nr:hypothetical protein [Gammaproteobacteria bacterium]|tara:strand:- start:615 stop:1226 length:612 start_codon:yes stop_codon:yes gene_type:complete
MTCIGRVALILFLLSAAPAALATTVAQLSFDDVVANAEFVFEGRVLAVEARETGPRSIHTFVEFQILDVIKGSYTGATIELSYLGGRVGNRQLEVSEMQLPEAGETGVYFVESLQEQQLHPLVGWSQGHYLIVEDSNGRAHVQSAGHQPIRAVSIAPFASAQILNEEGVASGVQIQAIADERSAMSAAGFKALVRERVQELAP